MNDKISEWRLAKELCEEISHLDKKQQLELVRNSSINESVRKKAISLIEKMAQKFNLIESAHAGEIIPEIKTKSNLIGKKVDDYILIKLLGSGGMSSVYLAKRVNADFQKLVALKILSPFATSEKYQELFDREQKSLAQLNHNNIISFHHGGHTEDGTRYLVMDYVEKSKDIVSYCNENGTDIRGKINFVKIIAETLAYAHSKNIIHRDLKSANILIDANNVIKIVDFGIAVFAEENDSENSTRVFTYDIASPEQILGEKVDARTDIFSLGALLLQLLTGMTPTPTDIKINKYKPEDVKRHIHKILKNSNLNNDLQKIINKAMHVDVEQRYLNMQLFAEDLTNFLNFKPILAAGDSYIYRTKKFLQRNPLSSTLTGIIFIVSLISLLMIYNNIQRRQEAENKTSRTMALIDSLFEQADPFNSGKNSTELVSTLQTIESKQQDLLASDSEFRYHFYQNMANIYNQNANYLESLKAKRKAIEALKKYAGPNNPIIWENQIEELNLLHATGNYSETITQSLLLLEQLKNHAELDPILKLKIYLPLSRSYGSLNQLQDEIKIHNLAIEYMELHPDIDDGFKADMLGSMAISQYRNGNKSMTAKLFDKTIETYKSLPNRKKNLVSTLRNYAAVNVNYGNYEKAEQLFLESINTIQSIDPKHPTLASTYLRYSSLLAKTGRINKAEVILITAIQILEDANDNVELPIAYTYLAELYLRKNDIQSAIRNLILAKEHTLDKSSIDHPKTLKIYNLSLWLLMLEPYQKYAMQLLNFMDETEFANSKNSKEYEIYQVQKAILTKTPVQNQQSISVLSQYFSDYESSDDDSKRLWLQQTIGNLSEAPDFVKVLMNVWLLQYTFDDNHFAEYCQHSDKWRDESMLALKFSIITGCIKIAEKNNLKIPDATIDALKNLQQQFAIDPPVKNLVTKLVN